MFNTEITYQITYNHRPQKMRLSDWLRWCKQGHPNPEVMEQLQQYRTLLAAEMKRGLTEDEAKGVLKKRKKYWLKLGLPLAAPGAICSTRRKEGFIEKRTGWIALDIDLKDNPHIEDTEQLRDMLMNNIYIAFAGLSTGGGGIWCLVKVARPEKHSEYFQQLIKDFASRGIVLDSTKGQNPLDGRFYSYDPGAKVKKPKIYDRLPKPQKSQKRKRTHRKKIARSGDVFEFAMQKVKDKHGYTFTHPGDMHHSIFQFCSVLNWAGVPKHEAENWININLLPLSEIKSNCITSAYDTPEAKRYFGAGKKDYSQRANHAPRRDSAGERKIQSQNSTPYGYNPYTGEIFDSRGYPADWDEVEAPEPGTAEYAEAEYYRAMDADPILKQIDETFEPELITEH